MGMRNREGARRSDDRRDALGSGMNRLLLTRAQFPEVAMDSMHNRIGILFREFSINAFARNMLKIARLAWKAPVTVTFLVKTFQHVKVSGLEGPRLHDGFPLRLLVL